MRPLAPLYIRAEQRLYILLTIISDLLKLVKRHDAGLVCHFKVCKDLLKRHSRGTNIAHTNIKSRRAGKWVKFETYPERTDDLKELVFPRRSLLLYRAINRVGEQANQLSETAGGIKVDGDCVELILDVLLRKEVAYQSGFAYTAVRDERNISTVKKLFLEQISFFLTVTEILLRDIFAYDKWVYLTIFVVCIIIFVLHIPIFLKLINLTGIGGVFIDKKIDAYTELSTARGFGMGFIERLITGILVFCYYEKLCDARVENRIFINSLVAFFISNFLFSEFAEISKRIYILFIYAYWILWCDLIKCFYYDRNKILFSTFVGLYCIVKTATTLNAPIHEYDNLLFGIKSYQERKYIFQKTFEEPEY